MVIVNQDKDEIVNFDRADSIWVCSDEDGRFTIEATADTNTTLGCYKTKERAKEVLKEIVNKYRQCNLDNNKAVTIIPKVYEMPKE